MMNTLVFYLVLLFLILLAIILSMNPPVEKSPTPQTEISDSTLQIENQKNHKEVYLKK